MFLLFVLITVALTQQAPALEVPKPPVENAAKETLDKLDIGSNNLCNNLLGASTNAQSKQTEQTDFQTARLLCIWAKATLNRANAYGDVNSGLATFSVMSDDQSLYIGKERYAAFFKNLGPGTGDPAVLGSSFASGHSSVKANWAGTTVKGQTIGANIVSRGGYHGEDKHLPMSEFGGYNPAGDTSGLLINTVVSSKHSQNAILEGVGVFAQNGTFDKNIKKINVQLAPMRQVNPDGSPANPGIGIALSASGGGLGYAVQANNTARDGSYEFAPGIWAGFLRYNFDDGARAPFDAFRVDQDGTLFLNAGSGTTPTKKIRAFLDGSLQILNDAGQVSHRLAENGSLFLTGGQVVIGNKAVIGPRQPAISDTLTDSEKITGILKALRTHGLID